MKNVLKNFAIAFGLFALVVMIGTCHVNKFSQNENNPNDTTLFHNYKAKVNALHVEFEKQIHVLKTSKDSLQSIVKGNKKTRFKLSSFSNQLSSKIKLQLNNPDSLIKKDSLKISTLNYIAIQNERDSMCNESINTLELIASKQDSILVFKDKQSNNLKDLLKQNELRERYLTEQLNTAYKQQRKILFRNKLCVGTLILLSGFTSALLINQTLK